MQLQHKAVGRYESFLPFEHMGRGMEGGQYALLLTGRNLTPIEGERNNIKIPSPLFFSFCSHCILSLDLIRKIGVYFLQIL